MDSNSRDKFTIAIICAQAIEAEAVEAYFDEIYDRLGRRYGKIENDRNSYLNGRIGKHNVVVCYMPGTGKESAAMVASDLRFSYTNIEIALVVGTCGAVPNLPNGEPIFLGDAIIGDSMVAYDFGKQHPDAFRRKGGFQDILGRPSHELRALLAGFSVNQGRKEFQDRMSVHLQKVREKDSKWCRPVSDDVLFDARHPHKHYIKPDSVNCVCSFGDSTDRICEHAMKQDCASLGCNENRINRRRSPIGVRNAAVHIGPIASADIIMNSGLHRDKLAKAEGVVAFETEGAGVWDNFPTVIIKGVCSYADSHRDRKWELYAATNGAAAAKTFLEYLTPPVSELEPQVQWIVPFRRNPNFVGRQNEITELKAWFSDPDGPREMALTGLGGIGKTQIALEFAYAIRDEDPNLSIFWIPCTSQERVEQAYRDLARRLELPGVTDAEKEVRSYMSQSASGKWLFIYDNADDEDMWVQNNTALRHCIPKNEHGRTLFTSRSYQLAMDLTYSNLIQIGEYDESTGIEFLRRSLKRRDPSGDHDTAILLLKRLFFLPLAITQAVAYIKRYKISLSTYVGLLGDQDSEIIEVLSEDFQDEWRYRDMQNAVATTWWITFQHVEKSNPLAAEYLTFMASQKPSSGLIAESTLPPATSANEKIKAIGLLKSYAFVSNSGPPLAADRLLDLHKLVQVATQNWARKKETTDI